MEELKVKKSLAFFGYKLKTMKRRIFVITLMLCAMSFFAADIKAQTDAYFSNAQELRVGNKNAGTQGFAFNSIDTQQIGFAFEKIEGVDDAPITDGLLLMSVTGMFYILTKRRKENK